MVVHRAPEFSIVLAGGRGTRMGSPERPKVCWPVDGRPVINRALDVYEACGIRRYVVVVGALAEQVMQTVTPEHPGVLFAYQPEQRGTGDAARVGLRALEALGRDADVLLVAGDRLIEPYALEQLIERFYAEPCDLALMVAPRAPLSTQGRVLFDERGRPMAVVEERDIQQRAALARLRALVDAGEAPSRAQARVILTHELDEERAAVAFDWMWPALQGDSPAPGVVQWDEWLPRALTEFAFVDGAGRRVAFTPEQVREAHAVNVSVYLARATALRAALARLDRQNAQREEYLSDIVALMARPEGGAEGRVVALRVDDPGAVMGFNTPGELRTLEALYRRKHPGGHAAGRDSVDRPAEPGSGRGA